MGNGLTRKERLEERVDSFALQWTQSAAAAAAAEGDYDDDDADKIT